MSPRLFYATSWRERFWCDWFCSYKFWRTLDFILRPFLRKTRPSKNVSASDRRALRIDPAVKTAATILKPRMVPNVKQKHKHIRFEITNVQFLCIHSIWVLELLGIAIDSDIFYY